MAPDYIADDLEKEIIFMEQELNLKKLLLDESRKKLDVEISEHAQTKQAVSKYLNENKELQIQLEVCLTGTQKREEENKQYRESLVKVQAQLDAYLSERQQLLDNCYEKEKENKDLKLEIFEVKEQLKSHLVFLDNVKQRKSKTEAVIADIMAKQEILNKEQTHLEAICKEGLRFAEKLSEETKFQAKFVQEAKLGQLKLENEIVRLMAVISEMKSKAEKISVENENNEYLEIWKTQQAEMTIRSKELLEINESLQDELNLTKNQLETFLNKY